MTTVAYRDGVIASDSLLTYKHNIFGEVQKVWKFATGALYGSAGDSDDRDLRALLADVASEDALPALKKLTAIESDIQAIFVLPDGKVFTIGTGDSAGIDGPLKCPYIAVGSGRQFAMGCMFGGGSAMNAVEAAIKHSVWSGGKIQIESQPQIKQFWFGKPVFPLDPPATAEEAEIVRQQMIDFNSKPFEVQVRELRATRATREGFHDAGVDIVYGIGAGVEELARQTP